MSCQATAMGVIKPGIIYLAQNPEVLIEHLYYIIYIVLLLQLFSAAKDAYENQNSFSLVCLWSLANISDLYCAEYYWYKNFYHLRQFYEPKCIFVGLVYSWIVAPSKQKFCLAYSQGKGITMC